MARPIQTQNNIMMCMYDFQEQENHKNFSLYSLPLCVFDFY
jgi:hypothetical protein